MAGRRSNRRCGWTRALAGDAPHLLGSALHRATDGQIRAFDSFSATPTLSILTSRAGNEAAVNGTPQARVHPDTDTWRRGRHADRVRDGGHRAPRELQQREVCPTLHV